MVFQKNKNQSVARTNVSQKPEPYEGMEVILPKLGRSVCSGVSEMYGSSVYGFKSIDGKGDAYVPVHKWQAHLAAMPASKKELEPVLKFLMKKSAVTLMSAAKLKEYEVQLATNDIQKIAEAVKPVLKRSNQIAENGEEKRWALEQILEEGIPLLGAHLSIIGGVEQGQAEDHIRELISGHEMEMWPTPRILTPAAPKDLTKENEAYIAQQERDLADVKAKNARKKFGRVAKPSRPYMADVSLPPLPEKRAERTYIRTRERGVKKVFSRTGNVPASVSTPKTPSVSAPKASAATPPKKRSPNFQRNIDAISNCYKLYASDDNKLMKQAYELVHSQTISVGLREFEILCRAFLSDEAKRQTLADAAYIMRVNYDDALLLSRQAYRDVMGALEDLDTKQALYEVAKKMYGFNEGEDPSVAMEAQKPSMQLG